MRNTPAQHRFTRGLLALGLGVSLWTPTPAQADSAQFVLVGQRGVADALGVAPNGTPGVFLTWDLQEGALPSDLGAVILHREGTTIRRFDLRAVNVGPAGDAGFYGAACSTWRCREAAKTLCEVLKADGDPSVCPSAPGLWAGYGGRVATALQSVVNGTAKGAVKAWAASSTHRDIALAMFRNRAYFDVNPGAGPLRYWLEGEHLDGAGNVIGTEPLGEVTVTGGTALTVGAPSGLSQVPTELLARCDAPEVGLVNGTVALTWDHPGASLGRATRFLAEQEIVGYDVFRKNTLCGATDASVAATLTRDPVTGEPHLPGFSRRNGVPVSIAPAGGSGFGGVQFMENFKDLRKEGVKVGDHLCYVVMARDFTGRPGLAGVLDAQVPDKLPPPAPWNVEAVPVPQGNIDASGVAVRGDDAIQLTWDAVNVPNYVRHLGGSLSACNLAEAATDQRLKVAPTAAKCGTDEVQTVPLSVGSYRIYAFDSEEAASVFSDPDGDGYGPVSEAEPGRSVCRRDAPPADPALAPADYFAAPAGDLSETVSDDGRRIVRFIAHLPKDPSGKTLGKGEMRWYRVASVNVGGSMQSVLSPPVRAMFPEDEKPARPTDADVSLDVCEPTLTVNLVSEVHQGLDFTGHGRSLRLVCAQPELPRALGLPDFQISGATLADLLAARAESVVAEVPFVDADPGRNRLKGRADYRVADIDPQFCADVVLPRLQAYFDAQRTCDLEVQIVGAEGAILGQAPVFNADMGIELNPRVLEAVGCGFQAAFYDDCSQGQNLRPISEGEVVDDDLRVRMPGLKVGDCGEVNEMVDGSVYRLGRVCNDGVTPLEVLIHEPDLGGGDHCLDTVFKGKNNVVSTPHALKCFKMAPPKVDPPQVVKLDFTDPAAPALVWRRPAQPIAGLSLEVAEQSSGRVAVSFLVANNSVALGSEITTPLPTSLLGAVPPVGSTERWCVRTRAVAAGKGGAGEVLSGFTAPVCADRALVPNPLPSYLPWPAVPVPPVLGADLPARVLTADGVNVVLMGAVPPEVFSPLGKYFTTYCESDADCQGNPGNPGWCDVSAGTNRCMPLDCNGRAPCLVSDAMIFGNYGVCATLANTLGTPRRMMVYRQEWTVGAPAPRPFIQVTPRLDGAFCGALGGSGVPEGLWVRQCADAACAQFEDPFFRIAHFEADPDKWPDYALVFVDEHPYAAGDKMRYQFVYFDERGEIAGQRNTGWLETVR